MEPMAALWESSAGGSKVRSSLRTDSMAMSVITGGAIALARLLKQLSNRQALGRQSKKAGEDEGVCT